MLKKLLVCIAIASSLTCQANISHTLLKTYNTAKKVIVRGVQKTIQVLTPAKSTTIPTVPCYSINFMWINRSLKADQQFIYPAASEDELQEKLLQGILKWSKVTQNAVFRLWYDSTVTTEQAVENTRKVIQKTNNVLKKRAFIQLRDVRTLEGVKNNPDVFTDQIPVYFRADLLRIIATVECIENEFYSYFVYSDVDIEETLEDKSLFDEETKQILTTDGFVMMRVHYEGFENGFHILSKHNKNIIQALKFAIIELNIQRARTALQEKSSTHHLQQIVFSSFRDMFAYFCALDGRGTLMHTGLHRPYDKEQDGFEPFGLQYTKHKLSLREKESTYKQIHTKIPTKKIKFPPAGGNYN